MEVDQEEVTTAIGVARSVARADDAEAVEATVHLARLAGPEAVKFLRRVIVTEGWASVPQRVRCAHAVLETGRFLGGYPSAETGTSGAFRGQEGTEGGADTGETS
jgi:hypothetical protein